MDPRKKDVFSEDDEFPSLDAGKSSEGRPLSPDSEMREIEYKAPEGFKYEFGYDEKLKRYGYILKPLETPDKPKLKPEVKAKQWKWGDELKPSPHMVNSFLNRGTQTEIVRLPVIQFDFPKGKGPNQ